MSEQSTPVHLTEKELSVRWKNISLTTLRRWRQHGEGPSFVRVGRKVLYPIAAIEQYEKENTED